MQSEWGVSSRDAQLRTPDSADEVWHLRLASAEKERATQSGSAAAGCRGSSPVHLGTLRFIIDAGCGHNLSAEGFIRAGAMGMIKRLEESITLNTAGGSSRSLGSVCVACPDFMGGHFDALVMPETPAVIS
eukprot:3669837-Pyramimonas_sp.AAC.1